MTSPEIHSTVGVVDVVVLSPGMPMRVLVMQRGEGTRCTGAWEIVHGRIEPGELPESAALRELSEETGLVAERLYSIACHSFYLHRERRVQTAVVFAAVVSGAPDVTLGAEHVLAEWLDVPQAVERLLWPRSR